MYYSDRERRTLDYVYNRIRQYNIFRLDTYVTRSGLQIAGMRERLLTHERDASDKILLRKLLFTAPECADEIYVTSRMPKALKPIISNFRHCRENFGWNNRTTETILISLSVGYHSSVGIITKELFENRLKPLLLMKDQLCPNCKTLCFSGKSCAFCGKKVTS